MNWFVTSNDAREMGFTHHAWLLGIVPGFVVDDGGLVWCSRSDILNPVEDFLMWIWVNMQEAKGIAPSFSFKVGKAL
jgi:hypothetical protein